MSRYHVCESAALKKRKRKSALVRAEVSIRQAACGDNWNSRCFEYRSDNILWMYVYSFHHVHRSGLVIFVGCSCLTALRNQRSVRQRFVDWNWFWNWFLNLSYHNAENLLQRQYRWQVRSTLQLNTIVSEQRPWEFQSISKPTIVLWVWWLLFEINHFSSYCDKVILLWSMKTDNLIRGNINQFFSGSFCTISFENVSVASTGTYRSWLYTVFGFPEVISILKKGFVLFRWYGVTLRTHVYNAR